MASIEELEAEARAVVGLTTMDATSLLAQYDEAVDNSVNNPGYYTRLKAAWRKEALRDELLRRLKASGEKGGA